MITLLAVSQAFISAIGVEVPIRIVLRTFYSQSYSKIAIDTIEDLEPLFFRSV